MLAWFVASSVWIRPSSKDVPQSPGSDSAPLLASQLPKPGAKPPPPVVPPVAQQAKAPGGQKRKQGGGGSGHDGRPAERVGREQAESPDLGSPIRQRAHQPLPQRSPSHNRKPAAPRRLMPGARGGATAGSRGPQGHSGGGHPQGYPGAIAQSVGAAAALDAAGHSLDDVLNLPISSEGGRPA